MNGQFSRKCRTEKLLKVREEYLAALIQQRNTVDDKIAKLKRMIHELTVDTTGGAR